MNLFRRRSSVNLGRYEGPLAVPVAPVPAVVDEGVLIVRSAVRMAAKNRMIVAAVRDGLTWDHEQFATFAVDRIAEFAATEETSAERVRQRRDDYSLRFGGPNGARSATSPADLPQESARREEIHTALGAALRVLADDSAQIDTILAGAREDALAEITSSAPAVSSPGPAIVVDESYALGRSDRIAALLFNDLSELAFANGTSLEQLEQEQDRLDSA